MATIRTREQILKAAVRLFARSGIDGASMRDLTRDAGVNLAAVNYHFGSKDKLVNEVFRQQLDILYQYRVELLDQLMSDRADEACTLEDLLEAFMRPALMFRHHTDQTHSDFVKLLARAFSERSDYLRQFLSERYGEINSRFFQLIESQLQHLPEAIRHQRIGYMVGALTYTMADFSHSDLPVEDSLQQLIRFTAAGLTAPHR